MVNYLFCFISVYIFMKYKHTSANSQQTLLANGDGQVPQSIAICSGKNSVNFYAETKGPPSAAKIIVPATVSHHTLQKS